MDGNAGASELVTAAELARLVGVSRGTVSNWRRRHTDFPAPAEGSESSPRFKLSEALEWMERTGRSDNLTPTERLSLASRTTDDTASGNEALAAFAAVVAGTPDDDLERVWKLDNDALVERIRVELSQERSASGWPMDHLDQARTVLKSIAASSAVETIEALQGSEIRRIRNQRRVSPWFARLLVDLALTGNTSEVRSLHDPAAGSGMVLSAAAHAGVGRLSGSEADPDERTLCRARLREEAPGTRVDLDEQHALTSGRIPEHGFDAIASSIPRESGSWWSSELVMDPRWTYGIPDPGDATLAWVQHALSQLRPRGRAVLALDPMKASRPSGAAIRRELVKRGALRCVIAFPTGIGTGRGGTHVWMLERAEETEGRPVLFVDTVPLVRIGAQTGPAGIATKVRDAVAAFFEGREPDADAARVVPTIDLLSERNDLIPGHHVVSGERSRPAWNRDAARESWQNLSNFAMELLIESERPPALEPVEGEPKWSRAALGDLERGGAVEILRATAKDDEQDEGIELQPGDLVFPEVVRDPEQVVVVSEKPVRLRPRWFVVRADAERVDPWFLVGFVRSEQSRRPATTSGTMPRLNPRKILIPLVPRERQRAYAEIFRRTDRLRRAAQTAAEQATELERQTLDALTGGALAPPDAA